MGPNLTTVSHLARESETAWLYTQVQSKLTSLDDFNVFILQLPWRSKDFKLNPFQDTCIGVQTSQVTPDYTPPPVGEEGCFGLPVLGHVPGYVPRHVLKHILKHVPKHVLKRMVQAVLMT